MSQTVETLQTRSGEQRGRSTALAVGRLRDLIVDGTLSPGSRIPERALCEQFALSRTPLREALKILEAEGLVTLTPNRGAIVTRLAAKDVEAVIAVLTALEGMAADLACDRMTSEEMERIARLHERMVEHHRARSLLGYFHANQAVHQAIVDGAGNPVLSRIYRVESGRIWQYRYAGNLQEERWAEAVNEHAQILDALRRREGALLRELLRVHMIGGWRVVKARAAAELAGEAPAKTPRLRRGG